MKVKWRLWTVTFVQPGPCSWTCLSTDGHAWATGTELAGLVEPLGQLSFEQKCLNWGFLGCLQMGCISACSPTSQMLPPSAFQDHYSYWQLSSLWSCWGTPQYTPGAAWPCSQSHIPPERWLKCRDLQVLWISSLPLLQFHIRVHIWIPENSLETQHICFFYKGRNIRSENCGRLWYDLNPQSNPPSRKKQFMIWA